ncbi:tyrosine-type recombinase/integrase [Paraburkholderia aspalathi]|uniref:tyrosine-type recombinase/integrase n=1 Tax=Paraburkholderia aspalathi TaxID=1324617 RepID=UPI001B120124|nr:integrase arm-type DNA-binding domain-containing protein [Paraburkholderia aspalathi]CAE6837421.1 Prophage integrase IntA [Paraburkholderia aspalathi]
MSLTDTAVRNLKPSEKPYKLADGGGMYLHVLPSGAKYWRLAYRLYGKQKIFAIGVYPQVSLAEARQIRDEAKKLVKQGIDPVVERKQNIWRKSEEQATTFELIAREWHTTKRSSWTESHAKKIIKSLEADIFPKLGDRSITSISAPDLLAALRVIEARGALEIAGRVLQRCNAVFRYAVATGRAAFNPAAELRGALKTPERKHHAALAHGELPEFLNKLAGYDGDPQTRLGLLLMAHTFVRTGELRAATWPEFNLELAEWRIPAERMKMREEHIVPLSRQAVALLRELKAIGGGSEFVFPSGNGRRDKHISENTLLYALYRMGYHSRATGHGFRATASTILNEMGFHSDWIERQLAHAERNKVRAAYNRAQYLSERRQMMQRWSDYLDTVAVGKKIVISEFRLAIVEQT